MPHRQRQRHQRAVRRGRGQAVAEFALILPVFLLMTVAVIDMARAFSAYISLTNSVSNAAVYAGSGTFLNWCAAGGIVPCPTGTTAANQAQNPGNIAYQIEADATGIDASKIVLSKPQCTPSGGGLPQDCTNTTAGFYSSVRITATYKMPLLTPVLGSILGGPIDIAAATTATIIQ